AEEMFQRAIDADPKHAHNLGNFAQFLFCRGDNERALATLARAKFEDDGSNPALSLEIAFYEFAHGPKSQRPPALKVIHNLVTQGVRSPGWDLAENVRQAAKDGFRPKTWLARLADVIVDKKPAKVLADWAAWRSAAEDERGQ
ncbi:MAG: hypothetical protein HQ518_00640, partial [Rhodopirellula sp.]|nr:hypothetical protein [Rhodopirellula sp.]